MATLSGEPRLHNYQPYNLQRLSCLYITRVAKSSPTAAKETMINEWGHTNTHLGMLEY